jgi:hypothetical protein
MVIVENGRFDERGGEGRGGEGRKGKGREFPKRKAQEKSMTTH